jgi:hypothetical protein
VTVSVQLGRTLDGGAVAELASFLDALTGEVPSNYAPPGQKSSYESVVRRRLKPV